ncbi:MAG: T9SS type A sorting domain-containing protein [Crocinitomicaceae bacterium]
MIYSIYKQFFLMFLALFINSFSWGQIIIGPTSVNCGGSGNYSMYDPQGGTCTGTWTISKPNSFATTSSSGSTFVQWGSIPGYGSVTFSGTCQRVSMSPFGGISVTEVPVYQNVSVQIGSGPLAKPSIQVAGHFCANETKTMSISAVPGAVSYTYFVPNGWSINGGSNLVTVNSLSVNVTAPSSGQLSNLVFAVRANGANCTISSQYGSKTVQFGVVQPSIVGSSIVSGNSHNEYFGINTQNLVGGTWSAPSSWVVTEDYGVSSQVFLVPSSGSGYVTLSGTSCGVPVSATKYVTITSGGFMGPKSLGDTESEPQEFEVKVFPNPANNLLFLEKQGTEVEHVMLLTMSGQVVLEEVNTQQLDVSSVLPGMYFLRVSTTDGSSFTRKVEIRH